MSATPGPDDPGCTGCEPCAKTAAAPHAAHCGALYAAVGCSPASHRAPEHARARSLVVPAGGAPRARPALHDCLRVVAVEDAAGARGGHACRLVVVHNRGARPDRVPQSLRGAQLLQSRDGGEHWRGRPPRRFPAVARRQSGRRPSRSTSIAPEHRTAHAGPRRALLSRGRALPHARARVLTQESEIQYAHRFEKEKRKDEAQLSRQTTSRSVRGRKRRGCK